MPLNFAALQQPFAGAAGIAPNVCQAQAFKYFTIWKIDSRLICL
jgi:hypothetical protein